ncbi:tetratricopeptide repeat protein [Mucilaginibacter sp. HMF5004]|uniref:tetratricopeptide repeat protein n=1 Tax=Mucilaginibacter rivuli TaxID=2857527 RepID=UPI001C5E4249|nr:tetratricopeptide repeat protein [Mucilaginibacter rivuli]MBW4888366.1 tetratricopeptide repeat protein [Mucilaginibacter rivuli]
MKKSQIALIIAVVAIMGYLFSLKPVALIKPKETRSSAGANVTEAKAATATNINVEYVSVAAKQAIGNNLAGEIGALEANLKTAGNDADKLKLEKQLAQKWDDVNQPAPGAFYYQAIARSENTYQNWINAGDRFNDAYKAGVDTLAQPVYVTNAVEAFENAAKLNPDGLDAKTGLGIAYVNGGAPSPMQGIALLLEVIKKDPGNRKASLNLGLFAMKSGQYEKAVERFKGMITQKQEVEPYFYLAESYKQLGMKKEAIEAYQNCKTLLPDPAFGQRIDEFIKELKN